MGTLYYMIEESGKESLLVAGMSSIAFIISIVAFVIALASRSRRLGLIIGAVALFTSIASVWLGVAVQQYGMHQVEAATEFLSPAHIVQGMAKGVSVAATPYALSLFLGLLPFLLSAFALMRAFARPTDEDPHARADTPTMPVKGKFLFTTILPIVAFLGPFVSLAVQHGGPQYISELLDSPLFGSFGILFYALCTMVLSIMILKRLFAGKNIPAGTFLLTGLLPWLSSFLGQIMGSIQAYSALESAAPDQRAAALAKGISLAIDSQLVGVTFSSWSLITGGIAIAVFSFSQSRQMRKGVHLLFGIVAGIPLLLTGLVYVVLPGIGGFGMLFAALMAAFATLLGAMGMGAKQPYSRSAATATLMAGLGFAAMSFAVPTELLWRCFSALEAAAPEQRVLVMSEMAQVAAPFIMLKKVVWIGALLPAMLIALATILIGKGGKKAAPGAILATLIFVTGPVLSFANGMAVSLPEWTFARDFLQRQIGFAPTNFPYAYYTNASWNYDVHAIVGLEKTTLMMPLPESVSYDHWRDVGGYDAQEIDTPTNDATTKAMAAKLKIALTATGGPPGSNIPIPDWIRKDDAGNAAKRRVETDEKKTIVLAIDRRLPESQLQRVLVAARATGANTVDFVGVDANIVTADMRPIHQLSPLFGVYASVFYNSGFILSVPIGPLPEPLPANNIFVAKASETDALTLSLRYAANGDGGDKSTKVITFPARYDRLDDEQEAAAKQNNDILLLVPDLSQPAQTRLYAAATAAAYGYAPRFSDPETVPIQKTPTIEPSKESNPSKIEPASEPTKETDDNDTAAPDPIESSNIKVTVRRALIQGQLPAKKVTSVIKGQISVFQACVAGALSDSPQISGRVSIKFIIHGNGAVQMAAIASSTLGHPTVENCMGRAMRTLTFDSPKGGGVAIVTVPFVIDASAR